MKRILCLILAVALFGALIGCHYKDGGEFLEPVEFYYPRLSEHFLYGAQDGVLASEMREASGHTDDLVQPTPNNAMPATAKINNLLIRILY